MLKVLLLVALCLPLTSIGCTQVRKSYSAFLNERNPIDVSESVRSAFVARSTKVERIALDNSRLNLLGLLSKSVRPISESYLLEKSLETIQATEGNANDLDDRAERLHEDLLVFIRNGNAIHFPRILLSYDGFAGIPIRTKDVVQFKSVSQADGIFPSQSDDDAKVPVIITGLISEISGELVLDSPHIDDLWTTLKDDDMLIRNLENGNVNTLVITRTSGSGKVLHHFVWPLDNFCKINFGEKDNGVFLPNLDLFRGDIVTVTNLDIFLSQLY